jgi:hypothetical protein
VCSGYSIKPADIEEETGARPDAVLQKPFDAAGLREQVGRILRIPSAHS